jgi:integrase
VLRRRRWALANAPGTEGGFLFPAWSNVRRDLHLACAKVGIPGCSPNDLRRTYGTMLREKGAEPQHIGAAMGDADSRMVERLYGKLAPGALARLLEGSVGVKKPKNPVRRGGIEPPTRGFSVPCSTD